MFSDIVDICCQLEQSTTIVTIAVSSEWDLRTSLKNARCAHGRFLSVLRAQ